MFKISEATAIALHSMIYISGAGSKGVKSKSVKSKSVKSKGVKSKSVKSEGGEADLVPLKSIAKQFEISEHHLSKVLQRLVKAGFLESAKGPKGGFKISPDKADATFLEIYEVIEGKMENSSCLFPSRVSSCQDCIMGDFLKKASKDFYNYLKNKKLSDFKI